MTDPESGYFDINKSGTAEVTFVSYFAEMEVFFITRKDEQK